MSKYGGPLRAFMLALTLLAFTLSLVRADDTITNPLTMCSSENTGASKSTFLQYNSVGSCSQYCAGYSFAILQGTSCYCSNVQPGTTVPVSNCSDSCPGYGTDRCGSILKQLYGYVQLAAASSTYSSEASSSATSSSSSSSSSSSNVSSISSGSSSTSTDSASSSQSTSASSSSSLTSPSSGTASPSASSSKTTAADASPASASSSSASATATATGSAQLVNASVKKGFWNNTGAVAGVFTAVGVIVAALIALLLFFLWRRRRDNNDDHEKVFDDNYSNTTRVPSSQHGDSNAPSHKIAHSDSFMEDGDNQLVPIFDQRVDPTQMYMRWEGASSQQSLQDNQDYSRRVLQVANPDE